MKKLFFVVDTYGTPMQPYIPALIEKLKEKTEFGGVFSVTKPVVESKEVVFLKQRPSFKSLFWAFGYYVKHRDYYKNKGRSFFLIKCIANLRPILNEEQGIIHIYHSQKTPQLFNICNPQIYDYVVTFHGYDTNVRPFIDDVWRKELSEIYNKAKALVFVSKPLKDLAISQLNAPVKKSFVSAGGVFVSLTNELRKTNNVCKFVTIGRMTWEKGYPYTLLAMKKLMENGEIFEYHIIGGGDDLKQIDYLVRFFHLEKLVMLHGFVKNDDAKQIANKCNVYLQCSVSEASPLTFKEAGLMSLPSIGTKVGGIPEIVIDGVTGILVNVGDIDGLTDAMSRYINEPALRREHGENAMKYCKDRFSIDAESNKLKKIYNSIDGNA